MLLNIFRKQYSVPWKGTDKSLPDTTKPSAVIAGHLFVSQIARQKLFIKYRPGLSYPTQTDKHPVE